VIKKWKVYYGESGTNTQEQSPIMNLYTRLQLFKDHIYGDLIKNLIFLLPNPKYQQRSTQVVILVLLNNMIMLRGI